MPETNDRIITIKNNNTYYTLTKDIRNGKELTQEDKKFLLKLQREELIELIFVYNNHIKNMNMLLNSGK